MADKVPGRLAGKMGKDQEPPKIPRLFQNGLIISKLSKVDLPTGITIADAMKNGYDAIVIAGKTFIDPADVDNTTLESDDDID